MIVRGMAAKESVTAAKEQLSRIVQMLMGMLRKFSGRAEFLREDESAYGLDHEQEHERDYGGKAES